jgi:class 3 adenylate cyclase
VLQPPSGTVTFLFTDIEGSTQLWESAPESMGPALERHDVLLRTAIETNGGYVVKTTGDGLHAAFTAARDAVNASVDAQLALAREQWPLPDGLRARIGIHTGPAEQRDGDYYGTAANRAARLMAIGHGGQILVSDITAALVRDDADIALRDLGEHRLRDLSRAERVHQVVVDGLRFDFPPLRSLDTHSTNLPT